MLKRIDWKHALNVAIGLLAIAAPIILYYFDFSSRAFSARIISSTEISGGAFGDIQLKHGATTLEKPHILVLKIENTGSRPITSSDFDGPFEIFAIGPEQIVASTIDKTTPKNFRVLAQLIDGKVIVQPTLFNPGDGFNISILTTGGAPKIDVYARIGGVKTVAVDNSSHSSLLSLFRWPLFVIGFLMFVISIAIFDLKKHVAIRRWAAIVISFTNGLVGMAMTFLGMEGFGWTARSFWEILLVLIVVMITGFTVSSFALYKEKPSFTKPTEE